MLSEEMKKKLAAIESEEPDAVDRKIIAEAKTENDGTVYPWESVKQEIRETQEARKKKGDLHVRIAASLHEEIIDEAQIEGVSINQYVATALAYYVAHNQVKRA